MKVRKVAKTRVYSKSEIANLTPFMLQYDKLHEVITNTPFNLYYKTDVLSNHVRPSGRKVTASNGCVYYVCGHKGVDK